MKAATDATWEVANTLAHHTALKGRGDAEECAQLDSSRQVPLCLL